MLILNVPVSAGANQQQYVMNTLTGAWCRFQGWQANCFELYNDELYFGGISYVAKAWNTTTDNAGGIFIDGQQAFNKFGSQAQTKRFTMMRPMLLIDSSQAVNGAINIDFDNSAPTSSIGTVAFTGAVWDTGLWDTALWADALSVSKIWQGATGVGYWGSPHLQATLTGASLQWVSTDVVMEPGGTL